MSDHSTIQSLVMWIAGDFDLPVDVTPMNGERFTGVSRLSAFGCLYPGERWLRLYGSMPQRRKLLREVQSCILPERAQVAYESMVRRAPKKISPDECWMGADALARAYGLPIGLYALGRTPRGYSSLSVFARIPWISPAVLLQHMRAAVP